MRSWLQEKFYYICRATSGSDILATHPSLKLTFMAYSQLVELDGLRMITILELYRLKKDLRVSQSGYTIRLWTTDFKLWTG